MGNNIIILGSNGQLGSEFIKLGPISKPEFNWISITREVLDLSKLTKDYFLEFLKKYISNSGQLLYIITNNGPNFVRSFKIE